MLISIFDDQDCAFLMRVHTCLFQFCARASASSRDGDTKEGGKLMIKTEKEGWKIDFSGEKPPTPLLDTIDYPVHLKNLSTKVQHTLYMHFHILHTHT